MIELFTGDARSCLAALPGGRFRCCVTSPPYWQQRQYLPQDHPAKHLEIGREPTPEKYIAGLVEVFSEVHRTLTPDGTLWVNLGCVYARRSTSGSLVSSTLEGSLSSHRAYRGSMPGATAQVRATEKGHQGRICGLPPGWKDKDLIALPWMLGLALQEAGWYLRCDVIWAPPNAMPESVTDRPTHAHEYVLLLSKSPRYYFDADAIREPHQMAPRRRPRGHAPLQRPGQPAQTWVGSARTEPAPDGHPDGRNCRSVWAVPSEAGDGEHVAPMPAALARRCVLAGSALGDAVLDPFGGRGTVGRVAMQEGRQATLIDLDERAISYARHFTAQQGLFSHAGSAGSAL